jgi:signal transduction histidine kinase
VYFLVYSDFWILKSIAFTLANLTINQIDPTHFFWLISNILTLLVIIGGIIVIILGMRKKETLKTGAGPWVISGLALTLPTIINEIFDELEIVLVTNFYPDELYQIIFDLTSLFLLFAALLLVIGMYYQIQIGERLSKNLIRKNIELSSERQELSNFAHTLSHELRNELSLIQATIDLIEKKEDCNNEDIDVIRRRTNLIASLINRSLTLADAGLVVGSKKPIDIKKLFQDVSEAVVPSSVTVKISDLPSLKGDREKLYQVLKNILENAVVHSKPETIKITAVTGENETQIRIANDGKPVKPEIRVKMFKENMPDEGLGLKIIQRIIEAHGWKISIDESGSVFIITIPKSFL